MKKNLRILGCILELNLFPGWVMHEKHKKLLNKNL